MSWQISASTATVLQLDGELYGYFYNRVKQSEDARELVSTTWLAAGKNYEHRCPLRYFVFAVAYRVLVGHRRRTERRVVTEPAEFGELPTRFRDLESLLISADRKAEAERCLALLPEQYEKVVRLALSGHDNEEIAEILQLNYNTVRSRLSRGIALLRKTLNSS